MPYWDWDYPRDPGDHDAAAVDRREWIERLEHSFEEAVRLRLRADVPVACYLSGGIDSCAVLGFASRLSSRPLRAYTLSFDHRRLRRGAIARANRRGCRARSSAAIDMRSEHLADHFADAIYHAERPFANAHAVAKYLLSRAVRDSGIKVVLTGEGSDEIFAGYPHFRRDLVLYGGNGHDPADKARLLAELEAANRVSAGMLMPQGSTAARERAARARLRAVEPRGVGADRRGPARRRERRVPRRVRGPRHVPRHARTASTSSVSSPGATR